MKMINKILCGLLAGWILSAHAGFNRGANDFYEDRFYYGVDYQAANYSAGPAFQGVRHPTDHEFSGLSFYLGKRWGRFGVETGFAINRTESISWPKEDAWFYMFENYSELSYDYFYLSPTYTRQVTSSIEAFINPGLAYSHSEYHSNYYHHIQSSSNKLSFLLMTGFNWRMTNHISAKLYYLYGQGTSYHTNIHSFGLGLSLYV